MEHYYISISRTIDSDGEVKNMWKEVHPCDEFGKKITINPEAQGLPWVRKEVEGRIHWYMDTYNDFECDSIIPRLTEGMK